MCSDGDDNAACQPVISHDKLVLAGSVSYKVKEVIERIAEVKWSDETMAYVEWLLTTSWFRDLLPPPGLTDIVYNYINVESFAL